MKPKFFNFPLIVLAYGPNEKVRLEGLVMWAIIDVGRRTYLYWRSQIYGVNSDLDDLQQAVGRIRALIAKHGIDADWLLETCTDGLAWALGVETLGLNPDWRDCKACMDGHRRMETFFQQMQKATGRTAKKAVMVYGMKAKWLLDAHEELCGNRKPDAVRFTYSHFAVLAAILSKVGKDKTCATVTWPEIQRRALGYANEEEMKTAQPFRQDGVQPLSRRQINDRLTPQLVLMNFIVRHVPKIGRKCLPAWYSSTLPAAELVKIAEETKQKRRGGWRKRYKARQATQTALAQNLMVKPETPTSGRATLVPLVGIPARQ